jgi:hypothetical protein
MTTTSLSLSANQVFQKIMSSKGRFVKIRYKSNPKPKAEFKNLNLEKITTTIMQSGVEFKNLKVVKEAIASGVRGEVGELPWGQYLSDFYPYIITHKDVLYLRVVPSQTGNHKGQTDYFCNSNKITKEEFSTYLTNSDAKKLMENTEGSIVFNIKLENLLGIPEEVIE